MSEWDVLKPVADTSAGERAAAGSRLSLQDSVASFDAYFVGEMLRIASKPIAGGEDSELDGGDAGRMYREMFFEEIGRLSSKRGGLGLAESMREPAVTQPREVIK